VGRFNRASLPLKSSWSRAPPTPSSSVPLIGLGRPGFRGTEWIVTIAWIAAPGGADYDGAVGDDP
jgi:hypothetical protein